MACLWRLVDLYAYPRKSMLIDLSSMHDTHRTDLPPSHICHSGTSLGKAWQTQDKPPFFSSSCQLHFARKNFQNTNIRYLMPFTQFEVNGVKIELDLRTWSQFQRWVLSTLCGYRSQLKETSGFLQFRGAIAGHLSWQVRQWCGLAL